MRKNYFLVLLAILLTANGIAQNIPSYVPKDGLVGYWPFNGNANDASGNGNHGTNNGATMTTDRNGIANSAYNFDGNSRITNNNDSLRQLIDLNNSFSIGTWFNRDASGNTASSSQEKLIFAFDGSNTFPYKRVWLTIGQRYDTTTYILFARNNGNSMTNGGDEVALTTNTFIQPNTWHYILVNYDGTNVKIYIDNKLVSKIIYGSLNMPQSMAGPDNYVTGFTFGDNNQNNRDNFTGILDELTIYNRALNEQEITALYTENNPCTSVPIATIKPQGPTTFVQGDTLILKASSAAGQKFQWKKDSVIIAGATDSIYKVTSSGNYTVTVTEQAGLCKETSKGELVTVTPKIIPSIPSYIPANGLVGYWPFNGNANDESGNGNHLTYSSNSTESPFTKDRFDKDASSINLKASGQYFYRKNASLPVGNINRTVSAWYKIETSTNGATIFSQSDGENGQCNSSFSLIGSKNGAYFWGRCNDKSWGFKEDLSWINIILVYNNNVIKCYKNGVLINDLSNQSYYNLDTDLNTTNSEFRIGDPVFQSANGWPSNLIGQIDDIAFYNRALTEQEISALYTGTNCSKETATSSNFNSLLLSSGSSVSLSAEPQGGVFTGASIDSNKFLPSKAKIGANKVQYNFKNSQGCNDSTLFTMIVADTVGTTCKKYDTVIVSKTNYDTITVTNTVTKYDTITVKNNVYDTVIVNKTKYDTITVTNNITKYDTVIVPKTVTKYDTVIIKTNMFDTVKVNTYDTITVTNTVTKYDTVKVNTYDTITVTNNVTKYDTVIVPKTVTKYDTVLVNKYDTITVTNNVTKYDTVIVPKTVTKYDTVKINTYDTITVTNNVTKYDTVIVPKTVTKYDTVKVNTYDTITVTDTVSILKINFKLTTGIKANQMTSMSIYPNPTSDVLIIDASDLAAITGYSYRILDVLGKEVYNALVTAAKTEISLKTLGAKGMYVLHILDANKLSVQTKQIVLE